MLSGKILKISWSLNQWFGGNLGIVPCKILETRSLPHNKMLQHLKPPLYGILILEEFQIISYNNKSFFPEVIEITITE